MTWANPFVRRRSASVARERLQILLTHERVAGGQADLIPMLREEVLAVVAKHVSIDPERVQVKIDRGSAASLLEINIELPGPQGKDRSRPNETCVNSMPANPPLNPISALGNSCFTLTFGRSEA